MNDQRLNLVPVTAASQTPPAPQPADPPEAPEASAPAKVSAEAPRPSRAGTRPGDSPADSTVAAQGPWRQWQQPAQTFSYRLPPELVGELDDRPCRLRIRDVGVTVAAAVTHLLDLGDDELRALVERADAAKPRRRAGRRPQP